MRVSWGRSVASLGQSSLQVGQGSEFATVCVLGAALPLLEAALPVLCFLVCFLEVTELMVCGYLPVLVLALHGCDVVLDAVDASLPLVSYTETRLLPREEEELPLALLLALTQHPGSDLVLLDEPNQLLHIPAELVFLDSVVGIAHDGDQHVHHNERHCEDAEHE